MATISMAIKIGRVVTYNEEIALIRSNDPSVTWSSEVM